jgi:UDP-glucose 4-epimerase
MINRSLQGKEILVYGDGEQKRSFSPISDCLHSLTRMVDAPVNGETINIGPENTEITINELARIVIELTSSDKEPIHLEDRPNEVKIAHCSSAKAKRLLGYEPQNNIRECLSEMVEYIKAEGIRDFVYDFPIEIVNRCPRVWKERLL